MSLSVGCQMSSKNKKFNASAVVYPEPEMIPFEIAKHGDIRMDPYYWMKDRKNPKVVQYLNAENKVTESFLKSQKQVVDSVFEELKKRTAEDDSTVPVKKRNYLYWSEVLKGKEHTVYYRKLADSKKAKVEVLINENELAKGHVYFATTGPKISPDENILSYAADTQGRRFYTHYFKDLKTGKLLPQKIENITSNLVWAEDSETVFYVRQDPDSLRAHQVFRYHVPTAKSELIYEEKDTEYSVGVSKSLHGKYIYLSCYHLQTVETRFLLASKPQDSFQIFRPRKAGIKDDLTDSAEGFYLHTNEGDKNYQIFSFPFADFKKKKAWKKIPKKNVNVYIQGLEALKDHLVVFETHLGLDQVQVIQSSTMKSRYLKFEDESYVVESGISGDYDQSAFRISYMSQRIPERTIEVDLKTLDQKTLKEDPVPFFNSDHYKTARIMVTARDGKKVPVSLVMKKDYSTKKPGPLMVYGYGSYGYSMKPWFGLTAISLVDRGFVYAIAHIRGGSELGRDWYDQGRMKNKMNTFYDFIDVTEELIKLGYGDQKNIFAQGGSAGGLLVGAVANLRPDLYKGIIAEVPFVDVITTMMDDTIPLTTFEYEEWGNPNIKAQYKWMKQYSPYDNIREVNYPSFYIRSGFHDSQVQYWEPSKWAAKLRDFNKSKSLILLHTNMEAGHGGASGRYKRLKESAEEVAFLMWLTGQ